MKEKKVNVNHTSIAELHKLYKKLNKNFTLVTQNIDGLHATCYP